MKIKNLLFRADSGDTVGWGHTMRCFALAKKFHEKNFKISSYAESNHRQRFH